MKSVLTLALTLVAIVAARPNLSAYEKLESINVPELVSNRRLLHSNAHCLIGDGKCSPQASDVKVIVPEAVQTICAKCTPNQKKVIAQVMQALIDQLPEEWHILLNKYDPDGSKTEALNKFLEEYA